MIYKQRKYNKMSNQENKNDIFKLMEFISKSCASCKHCARPISEEPCKSCGVKNLEAKNWEKAET